MKRLLLFSMICLICTGCGTEGSSGNELGNDDVGFDEDDYKDIAAPHNVFGFNMLENTEADDSDNLFLSPTSLFLAMSMVYNGADGETKDEIQSAFDLENSDLDKLNKATASLMDMLDKDTDAIETEIANSIWVSDDLELQDSYQKRVQDYLQADVHAIDISDDSSVDDINQWVQDATNDKITDIVESPLNQDIVALLLNAIYFNGDWAYPFDPDETTKEAFRTYKGEDVDVDMMKLHEDRLSYMEDDTVQAVSLPYGDGEMKMDIFVPKEDESMTTFKENLTKNKWNEWQNEFHEQEGTVELPKFELDYEETLNDMLQKMGIEKAFDDNADFPNMIRDDDAIRLSEVKQKTYVNVDETGTEAAGSTSTEMETTSLPVDEPFHIVADKPFFITITDDEADIILFMGIVNNPEES